MFYYIHYFQLETRNNVSDRCLYQILIYVGGQEELLTQKVAELQSESYETPESTPRSTPNSNVTTFRTDKQPVRQEVIDSSSNFLEVILIISGSVYQLYLYTYCDNAIYTIYNSMSHVQCCII